MGRREAEEVRKTQTLVNELVQQLNKISKLCELKLTDDLVDPDKGKLSQLAKEFATAQREEDKLKPTQLRRVFHDFKRMEQDLKRGKKLNLVELKLTVAELAYARGRGVIPQPFYELMKALLLKVSDGNDLASLISILTVLLAYHKYYEKSKPQQQRQGGEA